MPVSRTLLIRAAVSAALFSLATIVLLIEGLALPGNATGGTQMPRETLIIESGEASHTFDVEVARSPQEKALGLMYRTQLPAGKGMLFPYEEATEVNMWMRNTYISLDMVFIGEDRRVVHIARNTEPLSTDVISSRFPTRWVLEIAAGEAARLGIAAGDRVELKR